MKPEEITIQPIEEIHDTAMAQIIRRSLEEFGANKPGTVYFDEETDHLTRLFRTPGSSYNVALHNGQLLGGAGVFPTKGLEPGMAELVKMYIRPEARGIGLGERLMHLCMEQAREMGYSKLYLETLPELTRAIPLYIRLGFETIPEQLGRSNHSGCSVFMVKSIS